MAAAPTADFSLLGYGYGRPTENTVPQMAHQRDHWMAHQRDHWLARQMARQKAHRMAHRMAHWMADYRDRQMAHQMAHLKFGRLTLDHQQDGTPTRLGGWRGSHNEDTVWIYFSIYWGPNMDNIVNIIQYTK